MFTDSLFFYGLGVGIVEEMVFRGVIMTALEQSCNKPTAVLTSALLFGAMHAVNMNRGIVDALLSLFASALAGILFSLVTYHSSSIWSGALMHAIWNLSTTGLLHVGTQSSPNAIYNYVLKSDFFLISDAGAGIEVSVFSVSAYCLFIALAIVVKKNSKNPSHKNHQKI